MASKFDLQNAIAVLTEQKRFKNVPLHLRKAARRVRDGVGTSQDAELLRRHLGIDHAGTKPFKATSRLAKGIVGPFQRVSSAFDRLQAVEAIGAPTGGAASGLANTVLSEFKSFLSTKFVKSVATETARVLTRVSKWSDKGEEGSVRRMIGSSLQGVSPQSGKRALLALRRVATLGAAVIDVAGVAILASDAAYAATEKMREHAGMQRSEADYAFENTLGAQAAASRRRNDLLYRAQNPVNSSLEKLPWEFGRFFSSRRESAVASMSLAEMQNLRQLAKVSPLSSMARSQFATRLGVPESMMTENERRYGENSYLQAAVNPENFGSQQFVRRGVEREMRWYDSAMLMARHVPGFGAVGRYGERRQEEYRQQYLRDNASREVKRQSLLESELRRMAEQAIENAGPAQRIRLAHLNQVSEGAFGSEQGRHRAWSGE